MRKTFTKHQYNTFVLSKEHMHVHMYVRVGIYMCIYAISLPLALFKLERGAQLSESPVTTQWFVSWYTNMPSMKESCSLYCQSDIAMKYEKQCVAYPPSIYVIEYQTVTKKKPPISFHDLYYSTLLFCSTWCNIAFVCIRHGDLWRLCQTQKWSEQG